MSEIKISSLDLVYVLQAMRYLISNEAKKFPGISIDADQYPELGYQMPDELDEVEGRKFQDHYVFLDKYLNRQGQLLSLYEEEYNKYGETNLPTSEALDLTPETKNELYRFFAFV